MKSYWVSCRLFTVQVDVDERGIIQWTAPITRKFIGQPFDNLRNWRQWRPIEVVEL